MALAPAPLFKNPDAFTDNYVPPRLFGREEQLADALREAGNLMNKWNCTLYFYGSMGVGKTATARVLQHEAEESGIKVAYVNVNDGAKTPPRLLSAINEALTGHTIGVRDGMSSQIDSIKHFCRRCEYPPLIIIDEIHLLSVGSSRYDADSAIYPLVEMRAQGVHNGMLLISKKANWLRDDIDPSTMVRLSPRKILFPAYNVVQLRAIIEARAKETLQDGAASEEIIAEIAARSARENGDARKAVALLRYSAIESQAKGRSMISQKDVATASIRLDEEEVVNELRFSPFHRRAIYVAAVNLMKDKPDEAQRTIGNLFQTYLQVVQATGFSPLSQNRLYQLVREMELAGLLHVKVAGIKGQGRGGRSSTVTPVSQILHPGVLLEQEANVSGRGADQRVGEIDV